MTASDTETAHLHRRLAEHMDPETADALIERLPPDWDQVATKSDLEKVSTDLRGEMATLRTDLSRDLRAAMFMVVGFALAVVGMFATILVSGVPAAG
ncbi:MAG: hypothetical protein F4078_00015 [Acidimicrobiia bacterium]|nr:hypothetical protein [Acidimicrobiia bacterium]MYJ12722.1 hypothetical protein [Acidimicrobiia bacterium]